MLQTFLATLQPLLVLFLCIAVGFIAHKGKVLPENADKTLSKLETQVLCPALSISAFAQYCTVDTLTENYVLVLYGAGIVLVAIALALGLAKLLQPKDGYKRNIYTYALTFAKWGFMGNAIVPMILGGNMHLFYYQLFAFFPEKQYLFLLEKLHQIYLNFSFCQLPKTLPTQDEKYRQTDDKQ